MDDKKWLMDFFENYFWIVGLSLFIGGVILIWKNAFILIGAGVFFLVIAAIFMGIKKANANNISAEIVSAKTHKVIGFIREKDF